ncbi:MAG: DUF4337 domain-containing protein [Magnetococcales bacterium]|nr:DUF4337 domain-containing protein [Magnetococcales bacterium]MBF0434394.1 DUF4337 domain-containing protein [Magnetococcales bacterium]
MEILETTEKIEEAHGHHGHGSGSNSRVALMISVLAVLLAIVEIGGKSSQNTSLLTNIEAANTWSFFQAKHLRQTVLKTAADTMEEMVAQGVSPEREASMKKRISGWRADVQRYESEPEKGEGRKELSAKAKALEERRDRALSAYHVFEYGSASLQIAIVMASASIIVGSNILVWISGLLGAVGVGLGMLGWFAPTLLHL